jgi:hypothetical protein
MATRSGEKPDMSASPRSQGQRDREKRLQYRRYFWHWDHPTDVQSELAVNVSLLSSWTRIPGMAIGSMNIHIISAFRLRSVGYTRFVLYLPVELLRAGYERHDGQ